MLTVSSLIDFLVSLLRDDDAKAEFDRDPHGMLERHGLDGVTAQDVHDALPMVADHHGVQAKQADYHPLAHHVVHHDEDPVRAISQITQHYEVKNVVVNDSHDYNLTYVDDRHYDDHSYHDDHSTSIHAGGNVDIKDSFKDHSDNTVVKDSFNSYDNHGVDNRGGTIDHSAVGGHNIDHSLNSADNHSISHSGNADNSQHDIDVSDDHSSIHDPDPYSYHESNQHIQVNEPHPDEHHFDAGHEDHQIHDPGLEDEGFHHDPSVEPVG